MLMLEFTMLFIVIFQNVLKRHSAIFFNTILNTLICVHFLSTGNPLTFMFVNLSRLVPTKCFLLYIICTPN